MDTKMAVRSNLSHVLLTHIDIPSEYVYPNDEMEADRLGIQHRYAPHGS
jgi:hypothetical protein